MAIFYTVDKGLYANITNLCPCKCSFCIRDRAASVGDCDSLWLEAEPDLEEIFADLARFPLEDYEELVFCGYGEPLVRLQEVLAICDAVKSKSTIPIRINTNGLASLIHKKQAVPLLVGKVDALSISLNAPNSQRYQEICHPSYGDKAYPALLEFAHQAKTQIPQVCFTVVDQLSPQEIEECRQIAKNMDIHLRVRGYF